MARQCPESLTGDIETGCLSTLLNLPERCSLEPQSGEYRFNAGRNAAVSGEAATV